MRPATVARMAYSRKSPKGRRITKCFSIRTDLAEAVEGLSVVLKRSQSNIIEEALVDLAEKYRRAVDEHLKNLTEPDDGES